MQVSILKHKKTLLLFLLIALAYFPLFLHLDALPLRLWDESRLANSAIEMTSASNPLVVTVDGQPDMWSTKPPLVIWMQAIAMKLIGYNELAVRLPSALLGLFTVILLYYMAAAFFGDVYLGFMASIILVTSFGFACTHVTRTGDYDSALTFFSLCAVYAFWRWREKQYTSRKDYFWLVLSLLLATLTKSIAGLFFVPVMVVWLVYDKSFAKVLRKGFFWAGIACWLFAVGGYYLGREYYNPGYLYAVWQNDLFLRFVTGYNHEIGEPFTYYLKLLWSDHFYYWIALLIITGIGLMRFQPMPQRQTWYYIASCAFSFLFIISSSKVKIGWYDAPILPLLSLLGGLGAVQLAGLLFKWPSRLPVKMAYVILIALLVLAFNKPYKRRIQNALQSDFQTDWEQRIQHYPYLLQLIPKSYPKYDLAYWGYNGHASFYAKAYSKKGFQVQVSNPDSLLTNHYYAVCESDALSKIREKYAYEELINWQQQCFFIKVTEIKDSTNSQ